MYIRRTHTNNSATDERYYTYRLVANQRIGGKPRQTTLLNLGRNFSVDQDQWPFLCARIDELVSHQSPFFSINLPSSVEREAQRIAAQLIASQAQPTNTDAGSPEVAIVDIQRVDIDSLELTRPRSVAVEQIGLWSMQQLGFMTLLSGLGINSTQIAAIVGSIIARMAAPSSELASHRWLGTKSGLGELLDVDYETMSLMSLYRASDVLWKHHTVIEQCLFERVSDLFGLSTTVTLYDLTNPILKVKSPRMAKPNVDDQKKSVRIVHW